MNRLNENYPHISDGTAKALVRSTVKVMKYLSETGDCKVICKLINAFRFFNRRVIAGRLDSQDLEGINVFKPILQNEDETIENKLNLVAIFLAYFSIHRELHCLILDTIFDWYELLPDKNMIQSSDTDYAPGFYTIVSLLDQYEEVTLEILEYLELGLGHVLVHFWIPQWMELAQTRIEPFFLPLENNNLADLFLNDAKLDFLIATSGNLDKIIADKNLQKQQPISYFIYKICKRISLFTDWIPSSLCKPAARLDTSPDRSANGIHFDLQVLMEIIDHPELNFFQEPRLVILLHQAVNNLHKVPFHKLHAALGTLGSTQSLPAIINMIQFLICKFLINVGNTCELIEKADYQLQLHPNEKKWFQTASSSKYQIPAWFETSLLPPLPPITKSSFALSDNGHESEQESKSFKIISNLLLESLNMIILINTDILQQYQWMKIDPLMVDASDETFGIRHLVAGQFFSLYIIPIIMVAMLSKQLVDLQIGGILGEKMRLINGKVIFWNSSRLCETLIDSQGNIALYHFLKLCAKVSAEDMLLQEICLELLHQIFFGQNGIYNKQLCLENELTTQTLHNYIMVWNDSSDRYKPFFEKIFGIEQPEVEINTIPTTELYQLLPDSEEILRNLKEREGNRPRTSNVQAIAKENLPTKADLSFQSSNVSINTPSVGISTPSARKYNPYSTHPFEPTTRPVMLTPPVSFPSRTYTSGTLNSAPETYPFNPHNDNEVMLGANVTPSDRNRYKTVFNGSFNGEPLSNLSRTIESLNGAPQTPSKGSFRNPWDGSPAINATPSQSRIVSTGKNYILGGHNRIKNNSRAQSIHIDNFKSDTLIP